VTVDLATRPYESTVLNDPPSGGNMPRSSSETPPWWHQRPFPVIGRWAVLALATVAGFHQTLISIVTQTYNGDPLAYLLLLPLWGAVLVFGTQLQRKQELPIHDRQIDWILAVGLGAFILMLDELLRPRLGATAELVRIDIFALLLFLMTGCILLFGTRTTGRYWATWAFLIACWPLVYRLVGAALGGTADTYGLLNVGLTTLAVVIASARHATRRLRNGGCAAITGVLVLAVSSRALPPVAIEIVPSILALAVAVAVELRQNRPQLMQGTGMSGPNEAVKKPILAGVAVLVSGAILSTFSQFAPIGVSPQSLTTVGPGWTTSAVVPAGWKTTGSHTFNWTASYFGLNSTWNRYQFVPAVAGQVKQRIVVDALTATEVGPLGTYPAISCYKLSVPYLQSPSLISLGSGVQATLFYANSSAAPSPVQAQWVFLTWTWKVIVHSRITYQRLTVLTLDGASEVAGFPVPTAPSASGNVRSTFSDILRGASNPESPSPTNVTISRLVSAARSVVQHQHAELSP
jgi:hypothetical protein